MRIPSSEHESRTIPARFAALLAAIALALCCALPLAASKQKGPLIERAFSDISGRASNPSAKNHLAR